MKVTELNEGKKIAYAVKKTVLTLDGGRIALDLQKYQKDYPVTLDFMTDGEGNLLMNAFDSLRAYVAEVRLPAYETETVEVEDEESDAADTTPADEQDAAAQAGVTGETQDAETTAQGETQKKTVTRRLPLDMSKVELDLFAIDGIYINQLHARCRDSNIPALAGVLAVVVVALRLAAILVAPQRHSSPLGVSRLMPSRALGGGLLAELVVVLAVCGVLRGQAVSAAIVVLRLVLAHVEARDLLAVHAERRVYARVAGTKHVAQAERRDVHHNARLVLIVHQHIIGGEHGLHGHAHCIKVVSHLSFLLKTRRPAG